MTRVRAIGRRAATAVFLIAVSGLCATPVRSHEELASPKSRPTKDAGLLVGVGIADVTGEAADVGMMGYGSIGQRTTGIHQRLWARSFVIAEPDGKRIAIVVCDLGMIFQGVHQEVMRRLSAKLGDRYREDNVLLTATHTHSGPGGFSHYRFYNVTTFGFQPKTFEAIVAGIVRAIERADADLEPGALRIGRGVLTNASVNRSPDAYLRNPEAERARYGTSIDPEMVVLRFERGGQPIGALSWFATHPVSVTNQNRLISPDNKGYAAYHWEHDVVGIGPGERGRFVAAFANSNPGDMSPNLQDGAARSPGPTDDEFENTRIIGTRQSDAARAIFDRATEPLAGPIDYRFGYVDFSKIEIDGRFTNGAPARTCPAAFGQSFTAGTEDGRGLAWIHEGDATPSRLLAFAGSILAPASDEVRACHAPKIVVLSSGEKDPPWSPEVLPVQLLRIGALVIAAAPGEFTIMSGRRVRATIGAAMEGFAKHVVFTGYANAYAGYVTTPEEYQAQHYECGFTHFGPWTLPAWQQELEKLAVSLRTGKEAPNALRPRDLAGKQWSLNPDVFLDAVPPASRFGDVVVEPDDRYRRGEEVVAVFRTGHPKNDLRNEGTFLEVQRREGGGWTTAATDDDWSTVYRFERSLLVFRNARIIWRIPPDADSGEYRILHHGNAKRFSGEIFPFTGRTRVFVVEADSQR